MNNLSKYDPEDLESLMMHKAFDELLPEERAFVLRHISSPSEYEHLRTLLRTTLSEWQSEDTMPGKNVKQMAMKEFRKQHQEKAGWQIWLNTLFSPSLNQNYSLWISGSLAVLCVFIGVYFWVTPDNEQLAVKAPATEISEQVHELSAEKNSEEFAPATETEVSPESVASGLQTEKAQIEKEFDIEPTEIASIQEAATSDDQTYGEADQVIEDTPETASARVYENHSGAASEEFSFSTQTRSNSMAAITETASQESVINERLLDILYTAR